MSYTQYSAYGGNPYSNGPDAEAGQGGAPHPGQDGLHHEMSTYSATSQYSNAGTPANTQHPTTLLTQTEFLKHCGRVKDDIILNLTPKIHEITTLHQRALSSPDNNSSNDLNKLVTQMQVDNMRIRDQIKFLEGDALKTQDSSRSIKLTQSKQLKVIFEEFLKKYQDEEVEYKRQYRNQIERQYRIVNPDATDAEAKEAAEMDWGSEGVFQTALKSNRTGQATSVLGAVRARHNELQRIEGTLHDLAGLFADMAQIVEAQDPVIEHTEANAVQAADDVDRANTEINKANEHARRRRRLKWYCFLVTVLIILAIALGIGLGVGLQQAS